MIRVATPQDKKTIFDMYGRSLSLVFEDREDYFAKSFIADNTLVNEVNGHVCASTQVNYYPMILNGKRILVSYIFGLFYDQNKQVKNMNTLLTEAVNQQQYKTLVSIIPTSSSSQFEKYGFETLYNRRIWTVKAADLENASYQGVSKDFSVDELALVYRQFAANFNGYFLRSRDFWLQLVELLTFKRYNLAAYHNDKGEMEGYMIYYFDGSKAIVKELIYLSGEALIRLLCYGLKYRATLHVYTSENENIAKAIPTIRYKLIPYLAVRINDVELFNKLYQCDITSNYDGFFLKQLPLFNIVEWR